MNTYSIIAIFFPLFLLIVSFFDTGAWDSKRKYITKYPVYVFHIALIYLLPLSWAEEFLMLDSVGGEIESKKENTSARKSNWKSNLFDFVYALISGALLSLFFVSGIIVAVLEVFFSS